MGKSNSTTVIRPEKLRDYSGIHEVNRVAFRREAEARLIENLRDTPDFVPDLSFVAIGGKNVVGHLLFYPISIETVDGNLPALIMSPLAVRPELRKEDVGERLIRHGVRECRRLRYTCVVTAGALSAYQPYGFTPARWSGVKPSIRPPEADMLVLEFTPGLIDNVQGTLKIPPAFGELWDTAII